jgi:hypothetical protein
MIRRPVDSHPLEPVFSSADEWLCFVFVEVTRATASEQAARRWLARNLERVVPGEYEFALDERRLLCAGREWWSRDSQPARGPGPGIRELWRFDVADALTLRPVLHPPAGEGPALGPEAFVPLEQHRRAGRIRDADWALFEWLARAHAAARTSFTARRAAAPPGSPRVELTAAEHDAMAMFWRHASRLLLAVGALDRAVLVRLRNTAVVLDDARDRSAFAGHHRNEWH